MANLDDLKKSISEMSDEELREAILDARRRRRQPAASKRMTQSAARKVEKEKEVATLSKFQQVIAGLSSEERLNILRKLGNK